MRLLNEAKNRAKVDSTCFVAVRRHRGSRVEGWVHRGSERGIGPQEKIRGCERARRASSRNSEWATSFRGARS
jgi:hypothetical protein